MLKKKKKKKRERKKKKKGRQNNLKYLASWKANELALKGFNHYLALIPLLIQ